MTHRRQTVGNDPGSVLFAARRGIRASTVWHVDQAGQDLVEFTLILVVVALLVIAVLMLLGVDVRDLGGKMKLG